MSQPCPNCPRLQAENQRLLIEVAMLKRIITAARAECVSLAREADVVLARRSGVAPRVWGTAVGQGKTARAILDRLS